MIRRSTWVVLGLFLLALVVLWYFRHQEEQAILNATPTPAPEMIFNTNSDAPVRIRLASSDGRLLEMVDLGVEGWQIVEPELGQADSTQVASLINSLYAMTVASHLDPVPSDEEMGLINPAYTIQLSWKDGLVQILAVGSKTPTSSRYYARVDDGEAVLVSIYELTDVQSMFEIPPVAATATIEPAALATVTAQP